MASKVIELTGSRSRIIHQPLPQDDPRQRQPDISQARRILSWDPTIQLTEGLAKTIKFFESLLAEQGDELLQARKINGVDERTFQ